MILIREISAWGQWQALLRRHQVSTASYVLLCTAKTLNKKNLPFINYTQSSRLAKEKLCQCLLVTKLTIKDLHNVLELLFVLAQTSTTGPLQRDCYLVKCDERNSEDNSATNRKEKEG